MNAHVDHFIGLVTVTYNSAGVLSDFLESLTAQDHPRFRLYLIDNDSKDSTLEIARSFESSLDISIIENRENVGIAVGNNQGIVESARDGAEWTLLINNDTVLPPSTISTLVKEASARDLDMLAPLIEATDPPGSIWYAGGDIVRWQGMKPTHDGAGEQFDEAKSGIAEVGYASTCCLLINHRVFRSVGLMDPIYFVYYDDIDFAVRAIDSGFKFWMTGSVKILHKASSLTGGPDSPFFIRWRSRNWVLIARKHTPLIWRWLPLAYIQLWALARMVVRRDSPSVWIFRQKSFIEGHKVSIKTNAPRLEG